MIESGSTVSSSFGPSPNLQLISHFCSSVDDAPIIKMEILLSLLIANIYVDIVKLLVLSCIINSYLRHFSKFDRFSGAQVHMVYDFRTTTLYLQNNHF